MVPIKRVTRKGLGLSRCVGMVFGMRGRETSCSSCYCVMSGSGP